MMDTYEIERLERELPIWENADPTAFNDLEHLMMRTSVKLGREVLQLRAQLAAADLLVQSAVRLVDVAVRISEVDNDNRMMDDVADTQSALAAYRATKEATNADM